MIEDTKDFLNHLHLVLDFVEDGDIGAVPYNVQGYSNLRLVIENVGVTNEIKTYGKLKNQAAYVLLSTITGLEDGASVNVEDYDEVRFESTVYDASGAPRLIVSGKV